MRRIDHPSIAHENSHMRDIVLAIPAVGPENHIASFGLAAGEMLAHGRMVLGLGGSGDGFVDGFADGVLS